MAIQYIFNPFTGNFDAINTSSSPSVTTFAFSNNVSTFTDITGFLVDPSASHAFTAEMSIERDANSYVVLEEEIDTAFDTALGTGFDAPVITTAIQPSDQKILAGGNFSNFNGNARTFIVRLNPDGTEDTAFYANLGTGFNAALNKITVQADGKILVGGNFTTFNGNTRNRLVRLNSDGTEDTAFYANLGTGFNDIIRAIYEQTNTQLLIGGNFTSFNGNTRKNLVRLNSDGTEDTTFYTNSGGITTGASVNDFVEIASSGIVFVGNFTQVNSNPSPSYIYALNSDGTANTTINTNFGSGGDSSIITIDKQSTGDLVFGGFVTTFDGNTVGRIARTSPVGVYDSSFTTGAGFDSNVVSIVVQPDDSIVVGGAFGNYNGTPQAFISRLTSTGTIDSAFYASFGTSFDNEVATVSLQSNGALVLGGLFNNLNSVSTNGLARWGVDVTFPAVDLISMQTIKGVYHSSTSTWLLQGFSVMGDDTGISFQMTDLGQLQYMSSNLLGTATLNQMKFEILEL